MTERPTARQALRVATARDHDRVDTAFGGFVLSDRARYVDFLLAQSEAFLPVEAAIDRAPPLAMLDDWADRRRSALLRDDLSDLGAAPRPVDPLPDLASPEEVLGAIYVLEGSRLGGRMLERSVPAELPRRFLGASSPVAWRRLIEVLDRALVSDEQRDAAIAAARRVFTLFEDGARRHARTA